MKKAVLSSTMLLEVGKFSMEEISIDEAIEFAKDAHNYVGHSTVKILGIKPAKIREICTGYDEAIVIKPKGRLEFGKEYSATDIEEIGYTIYKISKI